MLIHRFVFLLLRICTDYAHWTNTSTEDRGDSGSQKQSLLASGQANVSQSRRLDHRPDRDGLGFPGNSEITYVRDNLERIDTRLKFILTSGATIQSKIYRGPEAVHFGIYDPGREKVPFLEVYAGIPIARLEIEIQDQQKPVPKPVRFQVRGASVRVITEGSIEHRDAKLSDACRNQNPDASKADMHVLTPIRMLDAQDVQLMSSTMHDPFMFYEGGIYTLCYSDDSSFASEPAYHVDIHPVKIKVLGGNHPCRSEHCMANAEYFCYAMHKDRGVAGNCAINLGVVYGKWDKAKGSWSERFVAEYGGDGKAVSVTEKGCATTSPDTHVLCPRDANCAGTDRTAVQVVQGGPLAFPSTKALGTIQGETLAACYCAVGEDNSAGRCTSNSHFTQQIGKLYFFVAVASISTDTWCMNFQNYIGVKGFSGVLSMHPFVVCIHCPPGGCKFDDFQSRVKMIPNTKENELPSWIREHGCRKAQPSRHIHPANKQGNPTLGGRSDYKFFATPSGAGFTLPSWPRFERIGEVVDICLCLIDCTLTDDFGFGWFKVGELNVVEPALIQGSQVTYQAGKALINEVGVPGLVGFDRHLLPYGNPEVLGLHKKGGLRLGHWDRDNNANIDQACAQETDPAIFSGLTAANSFTDRVAAIHPAAGEPARLIFDGGDSSRTITATKTGVVAACYCPMNNAGKCMEPTWAPLAVVVVAGPVIGQSWILPTYRIARFEYLGFDLRPTDTLTLVPQGSTCNANPSWSQGAGVITPCPRGLGSHRLCELGYQKGSYSTITLGQDTMGCDRMNGNCKRSYVQSVSPHSEGAKIVFTEAPAFDSGLGELGLTAGDTVVLESGITCDNDLCTQRILDEVKGVRSSVGLQMYIDCDEGSGNRTEDHIGPFDGELLGPGYSWITGKHGKAVRFSAVSQAIWVHEDVAAFDSDLPWSLLAWVNPENLGSHTIFAVADRNHTFLETGELMIGISGFAGKIGTLFLQQVGNVDGEVANMGTSLMAGQWSHIAVTYSGARDGTLSFFVNGALSYTRMGIKLKRTLGPNPEIRKHRPMLFGGVSYVKTRVGGNLDLDELRVYNTPLTLAEIQEVHTATSPAADRAIKPNVPLGNLAKTGTNAKEFLFPIATGWLTENPMGWPTFKVNNQRGMWRRTNRAVTKAELLSTQQQRATVCWNREGRSYNAGELFFQHPIQLSGVGMFLTIDEPEKSAPFMITFETAPMSSRTGKRYSEAEGPMTLELMFLNTDQFDLQFSDLEGEEIPPIGVPDADELHEASQMMCGKLFRELWSSDYEGFPMPKGCYLRKPAANMREIVIIFEARNGLRGGEKYQIVMNGRGAEGSSSFSKDDDQLIIQTGDDMLTRLHQSVEIGHAKANKNFKIAATPNDPRFAVSNGIRVFRGKSNIDGLNMEDGSMHSELVELKKHESFRVRLKGDQFTGKIKRNNQLRIWLWPLTAWNIPESCNKVAKGTSFNVKGSVYVGRNKRFGTVTECQGYRTAPSGSVNTILLTLPDDMSDLFGDIQYQVDITDLPMPPQGFLPTRFGAQISKADDTKPYYILTSGGWMHARTSDGLTVGKLLATDGNSKPFRGSNDNLLYVRFSPSLTMRSMWKGTSPPSDLGIMAPEGFRCKGASPALYQDLPEFVKVAGAPTGAGMPLPLKAWKFEGRTCFYKVPLGAAVFAGTSFIIGVRVSNPDLSLPVVSPKNKWMLLFSSAGYHNKTLTSNVTFASSGDEQSASQLPVLGKLANVLIQPSNFSLSPVSPTEANPWVDQYLSFFFRTDTGVGELGSIGIETPEEYDFGQGCVVIDLEDEHYATGHEHQVHHLPGVRFCEGFAAAPSRKRNMVRLWLKGPLMNQTFYGFRLRVRNPQPQELALQKRKWYIYTIDRDGNSVDGANGRYDDGVPMLPGFTGPWQLTESMLPALPFEQLVNDPNIIGVSVKFESMFPSGNGFTNATVLLRLPVNLTTTLRVAAPHGFVWNAETVLPWEPPLNTSWNASGNVSRNVTRPKAPPPEFPGQVDLSQSSGEVIEFYAGHWKGRNQYYTGTFHERQYTERHLYGFTAEIKVPLKEATTSSRVFYYEFGHTRIPRTFSSIVPAPAVRTLRSGGLRTMNHVAKAKTELLVSIETVTPIGTGGALVIDVPDGFVFDNDCGPLVSWPRPWPALLPELKASSCTWERPYLVIRPEENSTIPPALHRFRVHVTNPERLRPDSTRLCNLSVTEFDLPCWKFTSHSAIKIHSFIGCSTSDVRCQKEAKYGTFLDMPQHVEGFPIADAMKSAGLIDYRPGRDDRPQRTNLIRIRFHLGGPQRVYKAGKLQLQGPEGFIFDSHCLRFVETRRTEVFESESEGRQWGIDPWPLEAAVVDCRGNGDTAMLHVLGGLRADRRYAFRIQVMNPELDPSWNYWTLTLLGQKASQPFPSFPLWTFHDLSLQPLSPNKGPGCYDGVCFGAGGGVGVPIRITFRTVHDVRRGGRLEITAPNTFKFKMEPSPLTLRKDATPCMIRTLQEDAADLDWMETDRDCLVEEARQYKMQIVVQSIDYSFHPDRIQEIFLYALPPPDEELPQSWGLVTFRPDGEKLDIGSVDGYRVTKVMRQFDHSNVANYPGRLGAAVIAGREEITDFFFDIKFPENLNPSDTFVITAPPYFDLTGDDHFAWENSRITYDGARRLSPGVCLGFRYEMPEVMLQNKLPECHGNRLVAGMNITQSLQSGTLVRMRFRLFNPERSPVREKNYWKITHTTLTGVLAGSAAIPSWNIVPRLDSAIAALTGKLKSGGSITSVTLTFRTILAFTEVRIRALAPVGFVLARAIPFTKVNGISTATQVVHADSAYIVLSIASDGQDILEIELQNIVLPIETGLSQWYISTYEENTQLSRGEARIRDEVRFTGFLAPAHLKINSVELKSAAQSIDKNQGVLLASEATARINITLSSDTKVNDVIRIELQGGGDKGFQCHIPDEAQVIDSDRGLVPTTLVKVNGTAVEEWVGDAPARGLVLRLGGVLEKEKVYTLVIPVITPETTASAARERWLLNIFREGLPAPPLVATNDGVSPHIHLVMQLRSDPPPNAPRAPPLSRAHVNLRLDPMTSGASAFIVTAPLGFTIPEDCGPLYGEEGMPNCMKSGTTKEERMACGPPFPNITHCIGAQTGPNGEYQARFICGARATDDADYKPQCRPSDARFWVLMPKYNLAKADNWWMIEAIDILDWENRLSLEAPFLQVGWVRMPGFDLVGMSAEIWYGESSDIPVDVVVQFTNTMDIRKPGAQIVLYAPPQIKLDCDDVATAEPEIRYLSLPGLWDRKEPDYLPCRADMYGKWIALRLNNSLPKDTYVFTVRVQTPVIDPPSEQNLWSLMLRDVDEHIIETVIDYPGQHVIYGARAATPFIQWEPPALFATTFEVTVRLEVLDEFSIPISTLLVQLPIQPGGRGRRHAIAKPEDLRILKARGHGLPLASGAWSDTSNPNRIYVYLDPKARLRTGLYGIQFPVHILEPEEEAPRFNVWQLAMCNDRDLCTVGSKLSERGEVITSYAMGGFNEREEFGGYKPLWQAHKFAVAACAIRIGPWLALSGSMLLGVVN